jgi:serine/threonine protein kinase
LAVAEGLDGSDFVTGETIAGGMGLCVRIYHERSMKSYALKSIHPEYINSNAAFKRFVEEAKLWVTLSTNSGIVSAYCIERINELPVVCARWMERGHLRRYLQIRSPAAFYMILDRMVRTLSWVWTNHAVVHRDLKPENILFDANDWPYITDWGIARLDTLKPAGHTSADVQPSPFRDARLTATGQLLGTLLYAAPEQIVDASQADNRADVYSLGCIMYEWETGAPPFTGRPKEIAEGHLYRAPARIVGRFARSDFGADKVIMKCLEKRPAGRFQNYEDLLNALRAAAGKRDISYHKLPIEQKRPLPRIGWGEFDDIVPDGRVAKKEGQLSICTFDQIEPFLEEACTLAGVGQWNGAEKIYKRLFIPTLYPAMQDVELYQSIAVNYGLCLRQLGKADEAVQVLRSIAAAKRKPAEYFLNYSQALLTVGQVREAEAVAREGLRAFPQDHEILGNLVVSLRVQNRMAEALEYSRARLAVVRDVHSLEETACCLSGIGYKLRDRDWPQAFRLYREAADLLSESKILNPRYISSRVSLARVWFDLEQYVRASEELSQLSSYPSHPQTIEISVGLRADCLLWTGAFQQCVEFADRWLEKFPGSIHLERPRAEAMVDGFIFGRREEGRPVLEESSTRFFEKVVKDPACRRPSDFCFLGKILFHLERPAESLEVLRAGQDLFPGSWEIPYYLGGFNLEQGRVNESYKYVKKTVELGAWRPAAWEQMAEICRALGQTEDATQCERHASGVKAEKERLATVLESR